MLQNKTFNEYIDITQRVVKHNRGQETIGENELKNLLIRHEELTLEMEAYYKDHPEVSVTHTINNLFATSGSPHTYYVEAKVTAKKLLVDTDIMYHDFTDVSDIVITAIETETKEEFIFTHDRVCTAFGYYAGNVKDGIIEYFDWNYVYFLLAEELAYEASINQKIYIKMITILQP